MPRLMHHLAVCARVLALLLVASCCKNNPAQPGRGAPAAAAAGKPLEVASPAPNRPTTKEGCDACQGKWGKHGLAEADSCICKTKDAGKVCRDGSECQAD